MRLHPGSDRGGGGWWLLAAGPHRVCLVSGVSSGGGSGVSSPVCSRDIRECEAAVGSSCQSGGKAGGHWGGPDIGQPQAGNRTSSSQGSLNNNNFITYLNCGVQATKTKNTYAFRPCSWSILQLKSTLSSPPGAEAGQYRLYSPLSCSVRYFLCRLNETDELLQSPSRHLPLRRCLASLLCPLLGHDSLTPQSLLFKLNQCCAI